MTDDELILHIVKLWKKWWNDPSRHQAELVDCFGSIYLGDIFSHDFETLHKWYTEWKIWHDLNSIKIGDRVMVRSFLTKEVLYFGLVESIKPNQEYAGVDVVIHTANGCITCYEGLCEFKKVEVSSDEQ